VVDLYANVIRPLVFRLDPERAHDLAKPVLRSRRLSAALAGRPIADRRLEVRWGPLVFPTPVGLSPGFDKHGELVAGLSALGFGSLCVGTVMPLPRSGNPRPRIVRRPADRSMVNAMGLPSVGLEEFARRLGQVRRTVPVIASFGALTTDDYLHAFATLQPVADAVEVNLKCPNDMKDDGRFLKVSWADRLISRLVKVKRKPLFIKINSHTNEEERLERLEVIDRGLFYGVEGFAIQSTWKETEAGLSVGEGAMSGAPLLPRTLQAMRDAREIVGTRALIRARGGVMSGADAFQAIAAGANAVDILTAFVYEGWAAPTRIARELLAQMDLNGVESVAELVGAGARS
jgi:dihydroorotate dehydrogenase